MSSASESSEAARPTGEPVEAPAAAAAVTKDEEETVQDAGTSVEPPKAAGKTRLLKDVEAEEQRYIYKTLYESLDDEVDAAIADSLTVGDTIRASREAKAEFTNACAKSVSDKSKGCTTLIRQLGEPQNRRVATLFVMVSALMLTLPLVVLFGAMAWASHHDYDPVLVGGFSSLGTVCTISFGYVVYAQMESSGEQPKTDPVHTVTEEKKNS